MNSSLSPSDPDPPSRQAEELAQPWSGAAPLMSSGPRGKKADDVADQPAVPEPDQPADVPSSDSVPAPPAKPKRVPRKRGSGARAESSETARAILEKIVTEWFKQHWKNLLARALHLCGPDVDYEEICLQTVAKLCEWLRGKTASELRELSEAGIASFVYNTLLRNAIAEYFRKAHAQIRDQRRNLSTDAPDPKSSDDESVGILDAHLAEKYEREQIPDQNLWEAFRSLLDAVTTLTEEEKAYIRMRYIEGLTLKEIAKRLGKKSHGHLCMLEKEILQKLRRAIERQRRLDD